MRQLLGQPREYELPNDLLRFAFTTAAVFYDIGMAVGYMQVGVSFEALSSGILMRSAAIGALAGMGGSLLWPMIAWPMISLVWDYCRKRRENEMLISDIDALDPNIERKKSIFLLSQSAFFPVDVRLFFAAKALSIIGAVLAKNVGSVESKAMGNDLGRSVGALPGLLTLLLSPLLIRYLTNKLPFLLGAVCCCCQLLLSYVKRYLIKPLKSHIKKPFQTISSRRWYQESRHDVSLSVRLFFGAWAGYVAYSVLAAPSRTYLESDLARFNGFQMWATLASAGLAVGSPYFFAMGRRVYQRCAKRIEEVPTDQTYYPPHWYSESRMDIPWYARVFAGVVAAGTLIQATLPYMGGMISKGGIMGLYTLATLASPFVFFVLRALGNCCCPTWFDEEGQDDRPPLKMCFDMPWYARIGFAALAGSMMGGAFYLAATDPDSVPYGAPPSILPMVGMGVLIPLAWVTPFLMACADRCGFSHPIFNPIDNKKADLSVPWYARLFFGLCLGALIGTSLGNVLSLGDPLKTITDMMGPDFLNISNAVGAPVGGLIGGFAAWLLWPVANLAFEKAKARLSCCPEEEEETSEESSSHFHV